MRLIFVLFLISCTTSATAITVPCKQKPKLIISSSQSLQDQLTNCSDNNLNCVVGKKIEVNETLFMWGDSCLTGSGELVFNVDNIDYPYLFNIGISGKSNGVVSENKKERPFTGDIKNLTFTVSNVSKKEGRLIYYWRTIDSKLVNNTFNIGNSRYSATTSGNNNNWLSGAKNYIRKDILISGNTVLADSDNKGSEGIGVGLFDGAIIKDNFISGTGDDPIGVHMSKNVIITGNTVESVDGRIYVSNGYNIEISYNKITRISSSVGVFYTGIALIYSGWEHRNTNALPAPENYYIHHNDLYYNVGSIDQGAAINILGSRNMTIENNYIENNSVDVIATAIHILPEPFKPDAVWSDPTGLDTNTARVYSTILRRNVSTDQRVIMTGNCVDHAESIIIERNIASGYQFYCNSNLVNNRFSRGL